MCKVDGLKEFEFKEFTSFQYTVIKKSFFFSGNQSVRKRIVKICFSRKAASHGGGGTIAESRHGPGLFFHCDFQTKCEPYARPLALIALQSARYLESPR
jgi:hypothetical protein